MNIGGLGGGLGVSEYTTFMRSLVEGLMTVVIRGSRRRSLEMVDWICRKTCFLQSSLNGLP